MAEWNDHVPLYGSEPVSMQAAQDREVLRLFLDACRAALVWAEEVLGGAGVTPEEVDAEDPRAMLKEAIRRATE